MVLINEEMLEFGVKLYACWRRWSHYTIQYLVPADDSTLMTVSQILNSWVPGKEEMLLGDDQVEFLYHFTDRDFVHRQPVLGMQVVKVQCWYQRREE